MKIFENLQKIDDLILRNTDNLNHYLTFIGILFFIIVLSISIELTSIAIGGILLIAGSLYIYIGNVFYSVISYTVADICWLINAYHNNDLFGTISVTIGILVGFIVTQKMKFGIFNKKLNKD